MTQTGTQTSTLSLRLAMTLILFFGMLITGGLMTYQAYLLLSQAKLTDTRGLLFLEYERITHDLYQDIRRSKLRLNSESEITFKISSHPPKEIRTEPPLEFDSQEQDSILQAVDLLKRDRLQLLKLQQIPYYIKAINNSAAANQFKLIPLDLKQWFHDRRIKGSDGLIYIGNQHGQLLYSSYPKLNQSMFSKRSLVQRFIKDQLSESFGRYQSRTDKVYYGFYRRIPDSNIALFYELDQKRILGPIQQLISQMVIFVLITSVIAAILLQWPLLQFSRSLKTSNQRIE